MNCSVPDCPTAAETRGFCVKHYRRWLRHGDPLFTKRILGDDDARYWSHVDKNGPIHPVLMTRCWLWTGAFNNKWGYGQFTLKRRVLRVHRYAFFLANGKWPEPMCRHKCDVRLCVNPDHLEEGTAADNQADMVERGRSRTGTRHHNAHLSEAAIMDIRQRLLAGETGASLCREFGVKGSQMTRIRYGDRWGHLPVLESRAM